MLHNFVPLPKDLDGFTGDLIDMSQDLQRMQERVGSMLQALLSQTTLSPAAQPPSPQFMAKPAPRTESVRLKDPLLRAAVVHRYVSGTRIATLARTYNTSERSIRRILDRARSGGDPRLSKASASSANSSQQASRTLGKHAPDSSAGERRRPMPIVGQDRVEERAVVEQARNEPGSETAKSAATAEGDAPQPSAVRETVQSLGDIAAAIVARRKPKKPRSAGILGVNASQIIVDEVEQANPGPTPVANIPEVAAQHLVEKLAPKPPADLGPVAIGQGGIFVQMDELRLAGAAGILDGVPRPMALVFAHMADGGIYDVKTLTEKGQFHHHEALRASLKTWKPRLAGIGVELLCIGKEMLKLRPLEV